MRAVDGGVELRTSTLPPPAGEALGYQARLISNLRSVCACFIGASGRVDGGALVAFANVWLRGGTPVRGRGLNL